MNNDSTQVATPTVSTSVEMTLSSKTGKNACLSYFDVALTQDAQRCSESGTCRYVLSQLHLLTDLAFRTIAWLSIAGKTFYSKTITVGTVMVYLSYVVLPNNENA